MLYFGWEQCEHCLVGCTQTSESQGVITLPGQDAGIGLRPSTVLQLREQIVAGLLHTLLSKLARLRQEVPVFQTASDFEAVLRPLGTSFDQRFLQCRDDSIDLALAGADFGNLQHPSLV